jgi:hypothetical protein
MMPIRLSIVSDDPDVKIVGKIANAMPSPSHGAAKRAARAAPAAE